VNPFILNGLGVVHGGRMCAVARNATAEQAKKRPVTVPQILKFALPRCVECWSSDAWEALLQRPRVGGVYRT
jgi:hypothetical protein